MKKAIQDAEAVTIKQKQSKQTTDQLMFLMSTSEKYADSLMSNMKDKFYPTIEQIIEEENPLEYD